MKFNFRLKTRYWILIGIAAGLVAFINQTVIQAFLFGKANLNERIAHTLVWTPPGGTERVTTFSIAKGYQQSGNVDKEGKSISLHVMYPTQSFVPWHETRGPNPHSVYILLHPGTGNTMGDGYKTAIELSTLDTKFLGRKVVRKGKETYVLTTESKTSNRLVSEESYLFHDDVRGHWIEVRDRDVLHRGEGVLKNQPIEVYYHYQKTLEPNPVTMYHWVMDFVEKLQVAQPASGQVLR